MTAGRGKLIRRRYLRMLRGHGRKPLETLAELTRPIGSSRHQRNVVSTGHAHFSERKHEPSACALHNYSSSRSSIWLSKSSGRHCVTSCSNAIFCAFTLMLRTPIMAPVGFFSGTDSERMFTSNSRSTVA